MLPYYYVLYILRFILYIAHTKILPELIRYIKCIKGIKVIDAFTLLLDATQTEKMKRVGIVWEDFLWRFEEEKKLSLWNKFAINFFDRFIALAFVLGKLF